MLSKLKLVTVAFLFCLASLHANAEGPGTALSFNPDVGRIGEATPVSDSSTFRVCADKDNMPFSNEKQQGFENKIAELIAGDLGRKLEYSFGYDRFGYIRTTLNAHLCDVIIGTGSGNDMMLTSRPYYRSDYVFVYKKDSGLNITDWDSPDLRKARIGTVDFAPPTRPLLDKGLMGNVVGYHMMHDPSHPPSEMIDDLIKGKIDVAIIWGPIGGYFAKQEAPDQMNIVPCPEYGQINAHGKEGWNISVGVRKKDKDFLATIQEVLDRRKDDIDNILDQNGIPHMPVVPKAGLVSK
ncbi:bacterial extracellular solute-binding protein, family 3 [mine drainage metagenome]|uniref:Bacterial extracellular solute-binding protein, family 3 n=1 Tax=mine drainage metagenome TaxID=410659 RepID=A0A1J5QMW0_9ZZZZ